MNVRLTDNERGLLSAYVDGELLGAELERAEQLLDGSEEARRYLSELRAVDRLSSRFLGVPFSAATSVAASKITASSIKAAAGSSAAKTGLLGSWGALGIGGLVTAAVVTVGVVVWPGQEPGAQRDTGSLQDRGVSIAQAANLDSSSVIVPEMTPVELAAFAVDGTLPIGDARRQFITLASQSADSIAVALHSSSTRSALVHELARVEPSAVPNYDSLLRISRLAVLRSNDGALAVSPAVPELRLRILRALARVDRIGLSPTSHIRVGQLEDRLVLSQDRRDDDGNPRESLEDLRAALDGKRNSRYILINMPNGDVLRAQDLEALAPEQPFAISVDFSRGPAVSIPSTSCRTIGQYAFAPTRSTRTNADDEGSSTLGAIPVISAGAAAPRARVSRVVRAHPVVTVLNTDGAAPRERGIQTVPDPSQIGDQAEGSSRILSQPDQFDSINQEIQRRIQRAKNRLMEIQITIQQRNGDGDSDPSGDE